MRLTTIWLGKAHDLKQPILILGGIRLRYVTSSFGLSLELIIFTRNKGGCKFTDVLLLLRQGTRHEKQMASACGCSPALDRKAHVSGVKPGTQFSNNADNLSSDNQ
jgi:hypothetical protein